MKEFVGIEGAGLGSVGGYNLFYCFAWFVFVFFEVFGRCGGDFVGFVVREDIKKY